MGMSASQGMIFMLTAARNDLELQAQSITNSRMVLSRKQEAISTEYAKKTGNRQLFAQIVSTDGSGGKQKINLTATTLFEMGYGLNYNGVIYKYEKAVYPPGATEEEKQAIDAQVAASNAATLKALQDKIGDCNQEGEDKNPLQSLLIEGGAVLIGSNGEEVSISGVTNIQETYYTGDDAEAKAKYDAEIAKVQRKDKALEIDLQNIETEHKAVEENIESVRKVIDKNIESSVIFDS